MELFCKLSGVKEGDILDYWPRMSSLAEEVGGKANEFNPRLSDDAVFQEYARDMNLCTSHADQRIGWARTKKPRSLHPRMRIQGPASCLPSEDFFASTLPVLCASMGFDETPSRLEPSKKSANYQGMTPRRGSSRLTLNGHKILSITAARRSRAKRVFQQDIFPLRWPR